MATTRVQQGNIYFNYDPTKGVGAALGGVYTHQGNKEASKYFYDEDSLKVLMALDIDWNGAEITSTVFPAMDRTINTTADLLSWIKEGIEEAAVSGRTSEVVRRSLWIN